MYVFQLKTGHRPMSKTVKDRAKVTIYHK